jgi:glutamate/tyrosine decarboxylase-like PLP-dependent enzyme
MPTTPRARRLIYLPRKGMSKEATLSRMQALRERDVRWREGRVFSLVYSPGDEASDLLKQAYTMFFSENGLNPTAFPSLRKFETDVVAMTASLLGGDDRAAGNMTSGGTESIAMAVLTARQWARATRPNVRAPEMILPVSAHPAFEKAGHYFDVRPVHIPVGADLRADAAAAEAAINESTILMVGSAPAYPHGVVDPIRELARAAKARGVLMHVDACVGGFMLPFVRKLGRRVPDFDFSVPGVTSISVDLHKYAYAAKGASVVLYRDAELRRHQLFAYTDWPGGVYASPTMGGTRPGGAIAAAWAIFHYLGEEGYLQMAREVMETTDRLRRGIGAIPGLKVLGDPEMSVLAIASDDLNIYEVGDEMGVRGWHLDRQQLPPSLHLTINRAHVHKAGAFLDDLADAARLARSPTAHRIGNAVAVAAARAATRLLPEDVVSQLVSRASSALGGSKGAGLPSRSAAMYGMMGSLPNRGDLKELVLDLIEQFTAPQDE